MFYRRSQMIQFVFV